MNLVDGVALFAGGLLAGSVNAVAGGSSFLVFPLLLAAGLPPQIAAASGYVALVPANAVAMHAYRREARAIGPALRKRMVMAFSGSVLGSVLFVMTGADAFKVIVPWLILAATLLYAVSGPVRRMLVRRGRDAQAAPTGLWRISAVALEFLLYVYAGYFGAGVGIVLLALYALTGEPDIHRANAVKNAVLLATAVLSLFLFTWNGLVAWPQTLLVGAATIAGGYLSIEYMRRIDPVWMQRAILAWAVALTGWSFWHYG